MIITPLNETAKFASGGDWEPTAANFPCLKHFFKCDEATAATTLTCAITGMTIPDAGGITNNGSSIHFSGDLNDVATSEAWNLPTSGTSTVVFIAVMEADATGGTAVEIVLGGTPATDNTIIIGGSLSTGGSCGFAQGATAALTTTAAQTTEGVVAVKCTPATGATVWNGSTTTTTKGTGGASATPATWYTITEQFRVTSLSNDGGGKNGLYGFAAFEFTTAPSDTDMANAISWMNAQWLQGNKWIYPGWKGLS